MIHIVNQAASFCPLAVFLMMKLSRCSWCAQSFTELPFTYAFHSWIKGRIEMEFIIPPPPLSLTLSLPPPPSLSPYFSPSVKMVMTQCPLELIHETKHIGVFHFLCTGGQKESVHRGSVTSFRQSLKCDTDIFLMMITLKGPCLSIINNCGSWGLLSSGVNVWTGHSWKYIRFNKCM